MTQEECKVAVCTLLEESELNTIIDNIITSPLVKAMLEEPLIKDFVPRAVLSAAIKREYERFRPQSETGVSMEESIRRALSME